MTINFTAATLDEIPENLRDIYLPQEDGTYQLDIIDVKPQAEFDKVMGALTKERTAHKIAENSLKLFGENTPESINKFQDKIAELEAMTDGSDPAKLDKLLEARLLPFERQTTKANEERDSAVRELGILITKMTDNRREHEVLKLSQNVIKPEFADDLLLRARYGLTYNAEVDDFVDENGAKMEEWISIQSSKTPSWLMDSHGAGANGGGVVQTGIKNPWAKDTLNITEQGKMLAATPTLAAKLMAQAGK